ncbi:MAG: signal peptidase II [Epulopiscium sp.]|nr:signal peptidase II [Candidatus Epulonipiscium sp.]
MILVIVLIDQVSKAWAEKKLKLSDWRPTLKNKIYLTLCKNQGAALNLFEKYPKFVNGSSVIAMSLLLFYLLKAIKNNAFFLTKLSLSFIIGGGIGNIIDRSKKGYVVDFFAFKIKKSPIFNIADIFIIFGVILLQLTVLFKKNPIAGE